MIPLVIHIPHASTHIPDSARQDFLPGARLEMHAARLTDHFTDRLFSLQDPGVTTIAFGPSRLVVDPERFRDDRDEPMAARGQGVLYERGADGTRIRPALPEARRSELLKVYDEHHSDLTKAVNDGLDSAGGVLIIDAHSFPDQPLPLDLDQSVPRPDACIGTAGVHTPQELVDAATDWCRRHHWSVGVDKPYAGSIVPLAHFAQSPGVWSIMIEINRAKYMTLQADLAVPTEEFDQTQSFVIGLMRRLREVATVKLSGR